MSKFTAAGALALLASLAGPALADSESYYVGPASPVMSMQMARDTGSQGYPNFTGPGTLVQSHTVARDTGSQGVPMFNGVATVWAGSTGTVLSSR